jgi:hypothetical protein
VDVKVTIEQIRVMKHAIGYEPRKVKRGKYIAWRNYFACYNEQPDWEELVSMRLAIKQKHERQYCYHVSDEGIGFLSGVLGVNIIEECD